MSTLHAALQLNQFKLDVICYNYSISFYRTACTSVWIAKENTLEKMFIWKPLFLFHPTETWRKKSFQVFTLLFLIATSF